jgi:ArsR family transcriptional regulator
MPAKERLVVLIRTQDTCMLVHMKARPGGVRARKTAAEADCAGVFRAVGDATRLEVLQVLLQGPSRVGELARRLGVEQSLLSHLLRVLRDAGLVVAEREGKHVRYRIAPAVQGARQDACIDLECCRVVFPAAASARPRRAT